MTAVLSATWHDAVAGFLRFHGKPGFWAACAVVAVLIVTWRAAE